MSKRNKYAWDSLVNVGDSFTLTEVEHGAGFKFARQLVQAKNAACIKKGLVDRYKCEKTTQGMRISKVV